MTTGNLTILDNDTVDQYVSVGESSFVYNFPILSASELKVSRNQTLLTYGIDYSVSGIGNDGGGTIALLLGASTPGDIWTLWQDMPIERLTGFSAGAATILGTALNAEFAARLRVEQQLRREIRNSLRISPDDPVAGQDMVLPSLVSRAGKYLAFDANGEPTPASGTGNDSALRTDLANQAGPGNTLVAIKKTTLETADGVVVVNPSYPPGSVRRFNAALAEAGVAWWCFGQAATRVNDTTFTVVGNYTSRFFLTARIRLTDNGAGVYMGRVRNVTFGGGLTRIVVGPDGNLGLSGNVPAVITSLCRQELPTNDGAQTVSYSGHGSNAGSQIWNRDEDPTAFSTLEVHVGKGIPGVDSSGEPIYGSSAGLALRVCPTTRVNSFLSGGAGYGGGGVGGAGAQAVIHTGLPIPIIIGTNDQERLIVNSGTSASLFLGANEAVRFISPAVSDLGSVWMSFYEDDRTTRKGYFGFSNDGVNNLLQLVNEKAAQNIQIATPKDIWLSCGGGNNGAVLINSAASMGIYNGNGNPNGVVTANPGSDYFNSAGGAGVSGYRKEAGLGTNLNWVGK